MNLFDTWEFEGEYYEITTNIIEEIGENDLKTTAVFGGEISLRHYPGFRAPVYPGGFLESYHAAGAIFPATDSSWKIILSSGASGCSISKFSLKKFPLGKRSPGKIAGDDGIWGIYPQIKSNNRENL